MVAEWMGDVGLRGAIAGPRCQEQQDGEKKDVSVVLPHGEWARIKLGHDHSRRSRQKV